MGIRHMGIAARGAKRAITGIVALGIVTSACSDVPSGERDPALIASSTIAPIATGSPATATVPTTVPTTAEVDRTLTLSPLASESGIVDLTNDLVTIGVASSTDEGTIVPLYGPFTRQIGDGPDLINGTPFQVDVGPNYVELRWNSSPRFDEFEGVRSSGLVEVYLFVFERPVLEDVAATSLTFYDLVPEVSISDANTLSIAFTDGMELGEGVVARVLLQPQTNITE